MKTKSFLASINGLILTIFISINSYSNYTQQRTTQIPFQMLIFFGGGGYGVIQRTEQNHIMYDK